MASTLDILIRAVDQASGVIQRVGSAASGLAAKTQGTGKALTSVGGTLTKTLTPAAAGAAVALAKIGQSWDEAARTLRLGNTEAQFKGLMESAKRVAGGVTQPLEAVAAALDEVSDRTGLTGPKLEGLTKRFLQLEHITGEAASTTIPTVTRLFGDWSIKTRDQGKTLDELMRASEATGISVSDLASKMVQFGSPLRQLGFGFSETAAMFAKFEKEGVNVQTAMPGLRMALKNLSAPSDELAKTLKKVGVTAKEPKDALMQLFEVIKDMPSTADANALAFKVFGTRAGPDLAAAIREGRFDLGELIKEIEGGKATIKGAAQESTSLADRFAMLRNRVVGILGPFGDIGATIASGIAAVGPFLMGLGQVITMLGNVRLATIAAFGIWAVVAAAAVVAAVLIIRNWDKVKAFLLKIWEPIKQVALTAWAAIQQVWSVAQPFFKALFGAVKAVILTYWKIITGGIKVAWAVVKAVWSVARPFFAALFGAVKAVAVPIWHVITTAVRTAWSVIKGIWNGATSFFRGLFGGIKQLAINAWNTIVEAVKRIWNGLAGLWNRGPGSWRIGFPSWVPLVGGKGWDVPDLPYLAQGGLVTRPTLAMIGEAGPEAVIPLRRAGAPLRLDVRLVVDRRRFVGATDVEYVWGGRW